LLVRHCEDIVATRLVKFCVFDAVLGKEGALRHFQSLREAERHKHAVNLFEFLVSVPNV